MEVWGNWGISRNDEGFNIFMRTCFEAVNEIAFVELSVSTQISAIQSEFLCGELDLLFTSWFLSSLMQILHRVSNVKKRQ